MPRHRTVMTPRERASWLLRFVVRLAGWLVLGAIVGAATWGALHWAGAAPHTARWVAAAVALVTVVAVGIGTTMPRPSDPGDDPDAPTAS